MENHILPEFQKYLVERKFASPKNSEFYALWTSKFISFCNKINDRPTTIDNTITLFFNILKKNNSYQEWQITQAEHAVNLYVYHFLNGDISSLFPNTMNSNQIVSDDLNTLLKKVSDTLRIKHYSYRTEQTYLDWIKKFHSYLTTVRKKEQPLSHIQLTDFQEYISFLALQKNVSSSTQNQAFNALLFFFKNILNMEVGNLGKMIRAKKGPKIPVVLTVDEVHKLFECAHNLHLLFIQILYGSGLRLLELARLRVQDIDFKMNNILVRDSKGNKDRFTILPDYVKSSLETHLKNIKTIHDQDLQKGYGEVYLPYALDRKYPNAGKEWRWQYVFPSNKLSVDPRSGKIRRHHISDKAIQQAVANAVKKANIPKHATVHTLRHSFATHMLLNGINIREVQELLGHNHVNTTMIYTHVIRNMSGAPKSPLDIMMKEKFPPHSSP